MSFLVGGIFGNNLGWTDANRLQYAYGWFYTAENEGHWHTDQLEAMYCTSGAMLTCICCQLIALMHIPLLRRYFATVCLCQCVRLS
jgi:hypothetical protein